MTQITGCQVFLHYPCRLAVRGASVCHCIKNQGDSYWRASISFCTLLVNVTKFAFISQLFLLIFSTNNCAKPKMCQPSVLYLASIWLLHSLMLYVGLYNPYLPFLKKAFSHILAHKALASCFCSLSLYLEEGMEKKINNVFGLSIFLGRSEGVFFLEGGWGMFLSFISFTDKSWHHLWIVSITSSFAAEDK